MNQTQRNVWSVVAPGLLHCILTTCYRRRKSVYEKKDSAFKEGVLNEVHRPISISPSFWIPLPGFTGTAAYDVRKHWPRAGKLVHTVHHFPKADAESYKNSV